MPGLYMGHLDNYLMIGTILLAESNSSDYIANRMSTNIIWF